MIVRPVLCRPFVGRREELAYLRERRLEAGSSHGGVVLIAGDAGVGKSRLIAEFCGSLAYSRWRIGYGPCLEFASRPYGPILDVLARVDTRPFEAGAAATKQEQFEAIAERLSAIAARTALIIVIEDLHWADAATLDLLAYLAAKLQRVRALVLASFRPDDLHPGHPATAAVARIARNARAGRIDLPPLHGAELNTFIDEALDGVALPDETRRAVALAGEGNPFFTEELLKSAVESESIRGAAPSRRDLPQTVRATLLERLRPFDEEQRRIVTQAAVIGRTFGLDLLAATLETEPSRLLPALRRARDFQLVEEISSSTFRFRHGLTRDAIYGDFLGAELRPRHRTIALALEATPEAEGTLEALAYHWWAAGEKAQSARYNALAGDAAARVYAHEDAIAFYERALEFKQLDAISRGSIVEKIAEARTTLGSTKEAAASYSAAADIFRDAGDFEREARCRVQAAISAYIFGLPEPTAPLEAMLGRLDGDDYLAVSRVHLGLAWLEATFWFPTQAAYHLEQVDPRARAEAPDIGLRFHNVSAWVAMTFGDIEAFRREFGAWLDAARASGAERAVASAHANGAMCYSFFGMHEEALENVERALAISRAVRSRQSEESAHSVAALYYLMRGELAAARSELAAIPDTTENGFAKVFGIALGTTVGAHLDDQSLIEKWFDGFEATVNRKPEMEYGGAFAEIMVRRGRRDDAVALLRRTLRDCELPRGNSLTLLAAGRYGAPAERARAREYLVRAAEGPNELIERHALTLFDAYAAQSEGKTAEAAQLAGEAAAGFRRLRFPLLEAAALEVAGDLEAARALYRRCGAVYDVRRLGGDAPSRQDVAAPPAGAAGGLSAREREVAALAADGRSNVEIANTLSITYKTVEKHLASAYRKLGISSRVQLRAKGPVS